MRSAVRSKIIGVMFVFIREYFSPSFCDSQVSGLAGHVELLSNPDLALLLVLSNSKPFFVRNSDMRLLFFLAAVQCQIYKGMRAADHAKITKGPSQFGKLRTRGPTLPPPVEESQIFGAWIEGKRDTTKWVWFSSYLYF